MARPAAETAFGPMVIVAIEQTFPKEQRILHDPFAYQMLPLYMKIMVKVCNLSRLRKAFLNLLEKATPSIYAGMVCRKHYIQDTVTETPFDSIVILGSGLDTLAYRLPQLESVRIYEVDLPENINYKKKKLETIFGKVPSHISLVPVDFETQNLESVLKHAGYSSEQRTFYIWEAVTQYLTEDAVRETFQFLAKAKSGSKLVFSYILKDFLEGKNMYGADNLYQRFRVKAQIWLFGLHPHKVDDFISPYSWNVLEQVGAAEFTERYVKPMGRNMPVAEIERFVYAEKRG